MVVNRLLSSLLLAPQVAPRAAALVSGRGSHLVTYGDAVGGLGQHAFEDKLLGRFIFTKECDSVACSWAKPKITFSERNASLLAD